MGKFFRYVLVSGLTWAIDFTLFIALYWAIGVPASLLIARIAAGVFAFLAHKIGSFSSKSPINAREIAGYTALVGLNYFLSLAIMSVLPTQTLLLASGAKLLSEALIFLANFFVLKLLFRPSP